MLLTTPEIFIVDLDGVLTDGKFYYDSSGKRLKAFGVDDSEALHALSKHLEIRVITADKRGFEIAKARIAADMGFSLELVPSKSRCETLELSYRLDRAVYMGDGFYDAHVFRKVLYSIAPANAFIETKKHANYVTNSLGGQGAVAEACFHIADKFFDVNLTDL